MQITNTSKPNDPLVSAFIYNSLRQGQGDLYLNEASGYPIFNFLFAF